MATFRKRGNKWSFRIDIGRDPVTNNKRKQVTVSKSTEYPDGFDAKTVKLAAATMLHELSRGTYVREKDISFVDFAKEWFKRYTNKKKVSTVKVRKFQLLYLTKHFEFDKLKDISKKRYQGFLDSMQEKYAHNTIVGAHSTGKLMFDYAMEYDYIKINPTQYAIIPKTLKTVEDIESKVEIPKYLEKEELALFLKVAQYVGLDGDLLIFLTLSYSGMRDGELCSLKKSDFIKEESKVSITKTLFNHRGRIREFELLTPKNESSIRKTEVDPIVFKAL